MVLLLKGILQSDADVGYRESKSGFPSGKSYVHKYSSITAKSHSGPKVSNELCMSVLVLYCCDLCIKFKTNGSQMCYLVMLHGPSNE